MSSWDFRPYLPAPGQSRIAGPDARSHTQARLRNPRAQELFGYWAQLAEAPFTGITTEGRIQTGLFPLRMESAPARAMSDAACALLDSMTPAERGAACFPVDAPQWQAWQNTELFVERHGLRLDETSAAARDAVMAVLRASLSEAGYRTSQSVMRMNRYLGDLLGAPGVLGEWSYTFCLFGTPSPREPWGWQLFGHHLTLNCFVLDGQMVLTPAFFGAEPSHADDGDLAGTALFEDEERGGLELMHSLSPMQRRRAIVAHDMMGGDLPPGRRHFADNLHLGGAHQDNRVIPYEGLRARDMDDAQCHRLLDLVATYINPLPEGPRQARLEEVARHLDDTHFCWIGAHDTASPFYYRIQSPVIMIEFDHHTGVFLTNAEPARFHVHTIVRTPNGNDYGVDLLRQHYARVHHHGG